MRSTSAASSPVRRTPGYAPTRSSGAARRNSRALRRASLGALTVKEEHPAASVHIAQHGTPTLTECPRNVFESSRGLVVRRYQRQSNPRASRYILVIGESIGYVSISPFASVMLMKRPRGSSCATISSRSSSNAPSVSCQHPRHSCPSSRRNLWLTLEMLPRAFPIYPPTRRVSLLTPFSGRLRGR